MFPRQAGATAEYASSGHTSQHGPAATDLQDFARHQLGAPSRITSRKPDQRETYGNPHVPNKPAVNARSSALGSASDDATLETPILTNGCLIKLVHMSLL
jgi:hypothetical protein